ncbi:hypothetical protein ACRAWD_28170 [Caulobacter segnis]
MRTAACTAIRPRAPDPGRRDAPAADRLDLSHRTARRRRPAPRAVGHPGRRLDPLQRHAGV